jgi:hypothetical protein
MPPASMALVLRVVCELDLFPPESGACRQLRPTRPPSATTRAVRSEKGIDMNVTRNRLGVPSEHATTPDQPLISRRKAIGGGLAGLAGLGGLMLFPGQLLAKEARSGSSFVVLLKGRYAPVVDAPDLGLSMVDLEDGSYSTVAIYPVSGTPGNTNPSKAIGRFFVQFAGDLCAYHVPGGSFAMRFTGSDFTFVDDGVGGQFLEGTFELTVIEATGIYRPFVGGHNHMVDRLHFLAPGDGSGGIEEYCFCFVSAP